MRRHARYCMVYVDARVLVPLFQYAAHSAAAATVYLREKAKLVAAACIPAS
ncbi:hypothetical protein GCM10023165_16110 [Variovorax defluvii]|uniref:Uncharacterized protein n=1 Tax=Variovorax defluvii TaxID=913761 RepID=A0ABP8HDG3_9BURK